MTTATRIEPGDGTAAGDHVLRPATAQDLPACAAIWRDALNDYLLRLAQPEIPDDLGPILRLYGHLQSTDPERFVVAERLGSDGARTIDAFISAVARDRLWFLSMLFVLPRAQGRGLGRRLLGAVMPKPDDGTGSRATATDSVQPISNGLYGSLGMVPRVPLLRLVGRVACRQDRLRSFGETERMAPTATVSARLRSPASSAPSIATASASSGPPTTPSSSPKAGAASCTTTGRVGHGVTATPRRAAASGRSSSPSRSFSGRSSVTWSPPSSRVAPSGSGCPAARARRSYHSCGPASGSMASRPSCAGIGRSPITPAPRPSRPGSCRTFRTFARPRGTVIASRPMRLLLSCPWTESV